MTKLRVEQFLHEFTRWATDQRDILGVALVGSYLRPRDSYGNIGRGSCRSSESA